MKKGLCSFADSAMHRSLAKVKKQAMEAHYFDSIFLYDEYNLSPAFKEKFKDKLVPSRGFGYCVWKPQIILQTMSMLNDGDGILYMDAGCHFNKNGVKRMDDYFAMADKSPTGILGFQEDLAPDDSHLATYFGNKERVWTKGDIFDYFGVRDDPRFYNTGQITGTVVVVVGEESRRIIRRWLSVFETNWHLVDDSHSISFNFPEFKENRHDQSIFSIIGKQENIATISAYEIWQKDWRKLSNYPILAKRDKDLGWCKKCKSYLKQKIKVLFYRISKCVKR